MKYWLFKSEPGTWSWQDQLDKGDSGEAGTAFATIRLAII